MKATIQFSLSVIFLLFYFTTVSIAQEIKTEDIDPYLWLEDVDGVKPLETVKQWSKATMDKFSQEKVYQNIYSKSLEIFNSVDRIAYPNIYGDYIYNNWQDKDHERGIWRRATKSSYMSGNPAWETLLDLDEMSKKDGVKWVYKGESGLYPQYNKFIVSLSKGGGDAVVNREFDVTTKSFVENGFYMAEAKGGGSYLDENTLIVSSDFGAGTMTTSGYARQVKLWKRGIQLKDAALIFEGDTSNVGCWGFTMRDGTKNYLCVYQGLSFFTRRIFVYENNKLIKLDLPTDCRTAALLNNQLVINLKSDWTVNGKIFKQGALVSANFTALLKGQKEVQLIFEPDEFSSVTNVSDTKNKLIVNVLNNVKNELYIYTFENNGWKKTKVDTPDYGTLNIGSTDNLTDEYFFNFQNFLIPTSLYAADAQTGSVKSVKSLPAYFDSSPFKVAQYKAKSKDGTMIPYFVVSSKTMENTGTNATLLTGYGGFEIPMLPYYSGSIGNAWLEKGGVYVLANLRGGGEFGPKWHLAAIKEKKQNTYDDFHAVAEDLIFRKITSPAHLGIQGGSAGGLMVGVAFTQRPELYNAVVCAVPLLDMKRYNKLLAGASWMDENGNPDKPEDWAYIKKYSPYHNLKPGVKYPEVFFYTSTKDDRVHPAHARKMAAKMTDMGYKVYYYENTEGGHSSGSTNEQRATLTALTYSYLWMKLK